jgi:hypothetical protein
VNLDDGSGRTKTLKSRSQASDVRLLHYAEISLEPIRECGYGL